MHKRLSDTRGLKFCRYMLCVALTLVLNGCDTKSQWQLHEITGHLPDLRFSLISDTGQAVTDQSYEGYLVMLFFGFTNCQAECPTTLFRLAKIVRQLGDKAERARILFITLDPGRDTPQVLHRYMTSFAPVHAIGLTGTETEIENIAKRYRAAFRSGKSESDDITHGAAVYVFDPEGHARLLVTPTDPIEMVAKDLQHLLELSR